jgi:hypothetical protein
MDMRNYQYKAGKRFPFFLFLSFLYPFSNKNENHQHLAEYTPCQKTRPISFLIDRIRRQYYRENVSTESYNMCVSSMLAYYNALYSGNMTLDPIPENNLTNVT